MVQNPRTRRSFLQRGLAGAAAIGFADLGFLARLPSVRAEDTEVADIVRFGPEIEPLVRLLEDTPREKLLEEVASRIRRGTSYREVLAALLLAGVRNVQPRPAVGFKFHSVLVVNSAHIASQSSPPSDRWLPIFWALDYFKVAQAQDVSEGNWTMGAVRESALPTPSTAVASFVKSMESWDEEASDAAAAALARSASAAEAFEPLWRLGMRDYRSIGHKAIYVANSWRTLQCIGWEYAEPILRSLAYALLMHEGDNPATRDAPADRPWRENLERVKTIPPTWRDGRSDPSATTALLDVLREGSASDASEKSAALLRSGVAAASIWDALFAAAGELLLRQAGIISLHALTTLNALHFAYLASGDDETRRLAMLQGAAFVTLFRDGLAGRGAVGDARIDAIADVSGEKDVTPERIFEVAASDRGRAVALTRAHLDAGGDPRHLIDAARRLVFLKGNDAHDYKFSSAVLEDVYHVSPAWRARYLATSLTLLPSAGEPDNALVERTRSAFA